MADRLTVGVAARLSPLSPGADTGAEDGQGPHFLPGDRRVHEHQRHADPARSLRFREVRQAGGRLQHRLACSARSARSSARRVNTTLRWSAPAGWARRSRRHRSSPSTGSRSQRCSTAIRTKIGRPVGWRCGEHRFESRRGGSYASENIIVGVLAVPPEAAQGAADVLVDVGREDRLQLLGRGCSTRPAMCKCTRRTRPSSFSTRSIST